MSPDLDRDLGAWVSGDLNRVDLERNHGEAAAKAAAFHERMERTLETEVDPDEVLTRVWSRVDAVPVRTGRTSRARRTALLAVAAALLLGGSALAAAGAGVGLWSGPHERPPTGPSSAHPSLSSSDERVGSVSPSLVRDGTGDDGRGTKASNDESTNVGDGSGSDEGSSVDQGEDQTGDQTTGQDEQGGGSNQQDADTGHQQQGSDDQQGSDEPTGVQGTDTSSDTSTDNSDEGSSDTSSDGSGDGQGGQ